MSATILNGRQVRDERMTALIEKIERISPVPELAIIQVGDRPDSNSYIKAKKDFAQKIGILEHHIQLPEAVTQRELIEAVKKCNIDDRIRGIIIQLPLPAALDRDEAIESIDPHKDIDGLTSINVRRWTEGVKGAVLPATARGIRELFAHYSIVLSGKKVTVIGRSTLVGAPIAAMCTAEGAVVSVAHRGTDDLSRKTKGADIIISAVGKPGLIRAEHVREGQVVIDVGISKDGYGHIVGDVDFGSVEPVLGDRGAITPVPGGVGPMTVLGLFENLVDTV